jgi:hypothetical protein
MSPSSAENYMNAAKFAAKFPTAGNLSPTLIYELASKKRRGSPYTPEVISAILKEAETKRIGNERAWSIIYSMQVQRETEEIDKTSEEIEAEQRAEEQREAQEQAEAEAAQKADEDEAESILDDPAPDLPAPTETAAPLPRDQFLISTFEQGVKLLRDVMTKPASKFGAVDVAAADLESIAGFLMQVASFLDKARAS